MRSLKVGIRNVKRRKSECVSDYLEANLIYGGKDFSRRFALSRSVYMKFKIFKLYFTMKSSGG